MADTGERTAGGRGRGRVGTYYALADVGAALVLSIAPEGIHGQWVDAHGGTVFRAQQDIGERPAQIRCHRAARRRHRRQQESDAPPRLAVVSAADPVDRSTGRLVHLPDAPFLLGELDPVEVLGPYVGGPVTVDDDVNWAAGRNGTPRPRGPCGISPTSISTTAWAARSSATERSRRGYGGLRRRGRAPRHGAGPQGRAIHLIDIFGELGLARAGSTAIDVDRLLTVISGERAQADAARHTLGRVVGGVLAAVVALADPELVVIGGSWGTHSARSRRDHRGVHPHAPASVRHTWTAT